MLPERRPAPAVSGDDDNWGWLITFSDLVLQLFGFAVLAALGGAAVHAARTPSPAIAPAAPAAAVVTVPEERSRIALDGPAAPEVHQVAAVAVDAPAVDPATLDEDALPAHARDDDRLPAHARDDDAARAMARTSAAVQSAAASDAGAPADAELQAIGRYLEQLAARERTLAAKVATRRGEVVVEIGAMNGFRPGSADPLPAMRPLLAEVRSLIVASPQLHVEIAGHTDDVPIRTVQFPSNLELSLARASHIAQELTGGDAGLRSRVSAAGYGEQRPVASNADADGRARNRRVEIHLTRGS